MTVIAVWLWATYGKQKLPWWIWTALAADIVVDGALVLKYLMEL